MTTLCIEIEDINPRDLVVIVTRDESDLTHAFPYDHSVGFVFPRCAVSVHKNTHMKHSLFLIHDREGGVVHCTLALREDDIVYVKLNYDIYVMHLANEMYFRMGAAAASSFHFQTVVNR